MSFQELSKIILKSGNSDTSLDYLFTLDLSTTFIAELMAIGLLVLLPFSKKRKHLALITITGLMMSTLSCKKVNDIDPNEQSLYVRILQVDKDGGRITQKW
ncbi:hypothetical protein [Niabella hibiscisoli]|uniref:hypothetical protein n=1 Tax=Niabella hibiscisoli TaxID=1825928 RepID=UPI001F0FA8BC|nr:hypothetical protein [Niabella hibiscisoli]MCH5720397.1 hypothetical protein [Niabella hibiscisoli]